MGPEKVEILPSTVVQPLRGTSVFVRITQGSALGATLGCGMEPLRGTPKTYAGAVFVAGPLAWDATPAKPSYHTRYRSSI